MDKMISKVDEVDREVKSIIIEYEDGSKREISKGVFVDAPEDLKEGDLSLSFIKMSGREAMLFFKCMLYACVQMLEL